MALLPSGMLALLLPISDKALH